jgi:hypothetical protein
MYLSVYLSIKVIKHELKKTFRKIKSRQDTTQKILHEKITYVESERNEANEK